MRLSLLFAFAALPLLAHCRPDEEEEALCVQPCSDGAWITIDFPPPPPKAHALRFTLCRNDACVVSSADGGPVDYPVPTESEQICDPFPGTEFARTTCTYQIGDDGRAHVWIFAAAPRDGALRDGDVYRVLVTSETGAPVADASLTATYEPSTPFGNGCPGKAVCQDANLRKSL
jgi:hypothetical protein